MIWIYRMSFIEVSSAAIFDMGGESADPMTVKILEEEDIAAEADLIFRATFEEIRSLLNRNSDRIPSSLSKRKLPALC